jgi:hypothetical protein
MVKPIESPISAQVLGGYKIEEFETLNQGLLFSEDLLALWVDYSGNRLFRTEDDVKYRFSTYLPYIKTAAEDVQNITKSIIHEIKTYTDKYDVPSIILALAQNGGVCNVQKEVGLRMVYASMTDSILQHINSESIETKILIILRNLRETLSEKTAEKIIRQKGYEMNTHSIITVRNKLATSLGLPPIPDPNAYSVPEHNFMEEFMKLYTVDEIMNCIRRALNDSPRKMDYLLVLEFLEKQKPQDIEGYAFKQEFIFDDLGHFTDPAIRFMLQKMEIISQIQ